PMVAGAHLVDPRAALPDKCRAVFPYELFNAVQSQCFSHVYGSDDNVVVSAPTGSGKTAILEMAICKLVTTPGGENFKIVYQAPTKSLCSERAKDWEKKFSHLNLRCVELTGDTSPGQAKRVGSASIIVTTPEKWDSITRKWADHRKLLEMVRLVLIDEVHILKDVRGATLEAVVSRMKTSGANVRFVALSATVPNLNDIATWLGRDHQNQKEPAQMLSFGEEMRPVNLKKHVYGYEFGGNDFIFDRTLDGKLNMLLSQHSEGKPIMIFCFTRKSCEKTAQNLAEWWTTIRAGEKPWPAPKERVQVVSKELQEMVRYGVAFHHAGLDVQDRASIERNYLNGELFVICCTSTLAVGVNLPCHTVVLKGTSAYTDEGLKEYSDLEVMQMLGRAGRPQFDRSATAIIMTKLTNVQRYERMISGQEVLESKLHLNLIEHLNSEIGLGTIRSLETAKQWVTGTFLYVRMRQAPKHYRSEISQTDVNSQTNLDDWIQSWCQRDIELLQKYGLVSNDAPYGCTDYGTAMSRYMVQFETMKQILAIPTAPSIEQSLISLSQAADFRDLRFKPQEKAILRTMNSSVLYPIKGPIGDVWHKVYLLIQISLAGLDLPADRDAVIAKRQIAVEKSIILDRMNRLVRCVIECKVFDGDGVGTRTGLELTRAIAAKVWEAHPAQLQQVQGIGAVTMRKLASHGIHSVVDLATQSFVDIERIVGRNPPYGKIMLKSLEGFPRLKMTAEIVDKNRLAYTRSADAVSVAVRVRLSYCNTKLPEWNKKIPVVTFLADTTDGRLASFWRGTMRKLSESDPFELKFSVTMNSADENITCCFSCEEIVGTQVSEIISPEIPSSAFEGLPKQHLRLTQPPRSPRSLDAIASEDELADQDMLVALEAANANLPHSSNERPRQKSQPGGFDADFANIEDVLNDEAESTKDEISYAPVQLENGRWKCNHHCSGGAPTKNGKQCTHKCCHDGLDKPRPPPQKKKTVKDRSD
ncbi:P-loop containing nucleoside triphosphate hydrolase protein, partial [Truncatella angustata]